MSLNFKDFDVIVIGGGASGLMAASQAARAGAKTLVIERRERPGRKILVCGKGRCNWGNSAQLSDFLSQYRPNGRFLRQAFQDFFTDDMWALLESEGVPSTVDRGGRIFPKSMKAMDVVDALHRHCKKSGVIFQTRSPIEDIEMDKGQPLLLMDGLGYSLSKTQRLILATGGMSYPSTGSRGDGWNFAKKLGHKTTSPKPSLVGLNLEERFRRPELKGLILKNIGLSLYSEGKKVDSLFGEVEFMDFGLGGALAITLSDQVVPRLSKGDSCEFVLDYKPALDMKKLDNRILREVEKAPKDSVMDLLRRLMPKGLCPLFLDVCDLDPSQQLSSLDGKARKRLRLSLKEMRLPITGHRPMEEAIITAGGVSLKEINPRTMESRLIPGLYFCGELLDIHAMTGGYNLQAAFSTGVLAGRSAGASE